ncbi:hypothetical protein T10_1084, partial [Trichinella papuae]
MTLMFLEVIPLFFFINLSYSQTSKCQDRTGAAPVNCISSIVYKAPGQASGKIIVAGVAGNWQDGAAAIN